MSSYILYLGLQKTVNICGLCYCQQLRMTAVHKGVEELKRKRQKTKFCKAVILQLKNK